MDQRRVQQRMKHMEQETSSLNKQLSIAQIQIEVSVITHPCLMCPDWYSPLVCE